jgi:hypothetical protein
MEFLTLSSTTSCGQTQLQGRRDPNVKEIIGFNSRSIQRCGSSMESSGFVRSFARAEKIVVLDVPEWTRHWRVITRHFKLLLTADRSDYRLFFPTRLELIEESKLSARAVQEDVGGGLAVQWKGRHMFDM